MRDEFGSVPMPSMLVTSNHFLISMRTMSLVDVKHKLKALTALFDGFFTALERSNATDDFSS